jgi:diguanylate cyclase (GGDEF)-like protein
MHIAAALALARFLHRQALQLLIQDEEKTELVNRLERAKREAEAISQHLEVANRHLETLAATDALTGVANRRVFDLTAALEWRRAIREQTPMSMLLMDVDHFKAYNDFYGHQAGDTCLREVAATIRSSLHRPGDLLARYGGEEFAVVLSNTELDGAARVAGDLLAAIAGRRLLHEASAFGHVTVSIGAACIPPQADAAVEQLTALADAALYAAKRGGRNRVHAVEQATVDPATLAATLAVANLQTI